MNLALIVVAVALAASASPARAADEASCHLLRSDSNGLPSADCLACHRGHSLGHPVDLDYGSAGGSRYSRLRPAGEVVRRGVLLPDGQVRCVTCHDGTSPWKHRLALPPGARVAPAVNPRDPSTYDPALARPFPARPLAPGAEVSQKPLCLACHALD